MAKSFENFLARHRQAVIGELRSQIQITAPTSTPEELEGLTTKIVDFYYGRILGTLAVDNPTVQGILKSVLAKKTSRENMLATRNVFFEILDRLCKADTSLSQADQEHIQRMLGQSQKFLATDVAIVTPRNLKDTEPPSS